MSTIKGTLELNLPELSSLETTGWIEHIVEEYQSTGRVDSDALVRVLGDPMGGVSVSDPMAAMRDNLGISPEPAEKE